MRIFLSFFLNIRWNKVKFFFVTLLSIFCVNWACYFFFSALMKFHVSYMWTVVRHMWCLKWCNYNFPLQAIKSGYLEITNFFCTEIARWDCLCKIVCGDWNLFTQFNTSKCQQIIQIFAELNCSFEITTVKIKCDFKNYTLLGI